jgi:hypothetical protein
MVRVDAMAIREEAHKLLVVEAIVQAPVLEVTVVEVVMVAEEEMVPMVLHNH